MEKSKFITDLTQVEKALHDMPKYPDADQI
jgi:hypothetical protein